MKVNLKNKNTNQLVQTKVGFSWTTFFFGFFPALFRGDWKWAIIMIIASMLTFGFSQIIFAFVYNKLYINDLLNKGYLPSDNTSKDILISKSFIVKQEAASL